MKIEGSTAFEKNILGEGIFASVLTMTKSRDLLSFGLKGQAFRPYIYSTGKHLTFNRSRNINLIFTSSTQTFPIWQLTQCDDGPSVVSISLDLSSWLFPIDSRSLKANYTFYKAPHSVFLHHPLCEECLVASLPQLCRLPSDVSRTNVLLFARGFSSTSEQV